MCRNSQSRKLPTNTLFLVLGLSLLPLSDLRAEDTPVVVTAVPSVTITVPTGTVLLPQRTEVKVTLEQDLKSGGSKKGAEVPFEVTHDIYTPEHVLVIPAGTKAYGKIVKSSRRGIFGKPGKLEFTCDYIVAPDQRHIDLRGSIGDERGRNNTGTVITTTVLFGVLGLFVNGRDITVHKGQEIAMYIDRDTAIAPFLPSQTQIASVPVSPAKSDFILNDGSQVSGVLLSSDGSTYTVATDKGNVQIKVSDVKSINSTPVN